jgi:hypothetical protein
MPHYLLSFGHGLSSVLALAGQTYELSQVGQKLAYEGVSDKVKKNGLNRVEYDVFALEYFLNHGHISCGDFFLLLLNDLVDILDIAVVL